MFKKLRDTIQFKLSLWGEFFQEQGSFLGGIFSFLLGWTVVFKKFTTQLMYRQQGRLAGTFVHVGMAVFAIGVVFLSSRIEQLLQVPGSVRRDYSSQAVLATDEYTTNANTQISDNPKGEITEYRVQDGDTVASIAKTFGVSMDTILWENNLKSVSAIKPQMIVRILPVTGVRHTVKRGETIYTIAKRYGVDAQVIADYTFNTFANDETFALTPGQELIIPDGIKPNEIQVDTRVVIAKEVAPLPGIKGEGNFIWPTSGRITQKYSWYHTGVDIANHDSPPVVAAQGGTVIKAGWNAGGYGNYVVVDHGNGWKTLYAHMVTGSLQVSAGQVVKQGQRLGTMGTTGRSTGIHCHFEVFFNGARLDPLTVLK